MAHLLIIEGWISDSGNLIIPLLKNMGHTYTFVSRNPSFYAKTKKIETHPLVENATNIIEIDTNNIPLLIDKLRNYQFDGVITVCDYYFDAVRAVAKEFKLPCPLPTNLEDVRQKHLMRQMVDKASLNNAKYILSYSWDQTLQGAALLGYPLVIKPVDLGSSAFVRLVSNEAELLNAFDELDKFTLNFREQKRNKVILLEEFLKGEEISVESVTYKGNTTIIGITDKSLTGFPYFIESGHMFPAILSKNTESQVIEYSKNVLKAVGFDNGISHMEIKLTDEGPKVVEINPRTPGGYITELIERVTGVHLLNIFIELALGKSPSLLTVDTGIRSAAVKFLVPPKMGVIKQIEGIDTLVSDANVVRYDLNDYKNQAVNEPIDNDCYLGHIITVDSKDKLARRYADEAMEQINIIYAE